ncbi:hypothetical protein JMJ77_0013470 [Colletotrichum scovillei]|uniref:Uncharacterized protein n=1 Tax=Colletotrichum scovillei TaxID=1209932 RepID=A0A9P7R5S4_9PEZI|nr:hypothetical protein JMJ77_0013470 [Colletotrichum scovillei]KAG7069771.1 hypothetical protein JMJ76_0003434 [Colletotrichum scovillei]KAG7073715.1 hypothetical protein JMJ78_0014683 [Colletotrichum scovillei]
MPMSRFPPVTLTSIFTGQIQRFTSCSPTIRTPLTAHLRILFQKHDQAECSLTYPTFVTSYTLLRHRCDFRVKWHSSEDAFSFIGHHLVFIFDHPQHSLSTLWLAQRSIAALRGSPAGCRRRNQPPFFPCPGRRRPSANRRTGCGQENHHPQSWLELLVRGICYILCVVRHPRKTSRLVGVVEFSVTKYPYFGGLHRLLVLTNPIPSPARFPDFTRGVPCFAAGERTNQPTGARSYCFALLPSLLSDSAPSSLAASSFAVPALLLCPSNSYTKRTTQCIWSTYDYCSRQTPFRTPPLISLKLQSSFFSRIPCEEERSGLDNLQATTSTGPSPSGRRGRRSSVSSFNKALPTSRISPHIASSGSLGAKRDYAHPRLHSATCAGELLDLSRAATGVSVSHKRSTVTRLGRLD